MATPNPSFRTFRSLYTYLLTNLPPPLLPPPSSPSPALAHAIASLSLHPYLETALHILNQDLPSAHFLVRHMQAPPAYEGMFLHGILHRVEGDYDNARAWYGNVSESEVFKSVWPGGEEEARTFIGRVEGLRKRREGDKERLGEESLREIKGVVEFVRKSVGEEPVRDASHVWVQPAEEHRKMGEDMVVGGEGWRKF